MVTIQNSLVEISKKVVQMLIWASHKICHNNYGIYLHCIKNASTTVFEFLLQYTLKTSKRMIIKMSLPSITTHHMTYHMICNYFLTLPQKIIGSGCYRHIVTTSSCPVTHDSLVMFLPEPLLDHQIHTCGPTEISNNIEKYTSPSQE